jgi:adenosylcobyric acid synthase
MSRTLLVAGTASHVGKSTVVAGLCRLLARRGVDVAPFKAQNMSNNARVALRPDAVAGGDDATGDGATEGDGATGDGDAWGEVGVSQWVQARAAGVVPTTDHNPVLLKPRGEGESQLVVHGEAREHVPAGEYYDEHWERAREAVVESHRRLAADHDVVVAEGAGSIAEVNLHDRDLANVETTRIADADVLVVADIERGGAFASLYGTLELMPDDVRERVVGAAITKFRGDRSLLASGIEEIEARTGVPVVGVLPYDDPGLPEEDSVALPDVDERAVRGADDGVADDRAVTVAVPRLPRISNATDVAPLVREPGVRVAYVPPAGDLAGADAVVLPGTKNTVDDLLALRAAGFGAALRSFEGPVVGLCGGYQLLGERITGADVEGTGDREVVEGFGLLPVETAFSHEKRVARVRRTLSGAGPLSGATGSVEGYEIHMGDTRHLADLPRPLDGVSAATDRVLGTYVHGLFENGVAREAFLETVFDATGRSRPDRAGAAADPYRRAADLLAEYVDLTALEVETGSPSG